MEKRITITEETVDNDVQLEADKGTRITNQVNNNLDAVKDLNDDEDVDELEDDENISEEEVIIEEEEDVDEEDDDNDE